MGKDQLTESQYQILAWLSLSAGGSKRWCDLAANLRQMPALPQDIEALASRGLILQQQSKLPNSFRLALTDAGLAAIVAQPPQPPPPKPDPADQKSEE